MLKKKSIGSDGVEAWSVALAACYISFVMEGLGKASGIFYVAFIDIFHVNRLQASIPFTTRSLARNLFGPIVGIIGQKYGVRTTTIIGGIIGSLSAFFCFYSDNIVWFTILWGAFNGVGVSLCLTLFQVVINQHFKKYRTTASGMASSGGSVGSFFFPVFLEYLIKSYGLGGTFLILSGLHMNVIPAAMLLKTPSWLKKESTESIVLLGKDENVTCHFHNEHLQKDLNEFDKEHFNKEEIIFHESKKDQCNAIVQNKDLAARRISDLSLINTTFLRKNSGSFIKLMKNINSLIEVDNVESTFSILPESILQKYLDDLFTFIENISNSSLTKIIPKEPPNVSKSSSDSKFVKKDCKNANREEMVLSTTKLKIDGLDDGFYSSLTIQINNIIKAYIKNNKSGFLKKEQPKLSSLIEQFKYIFEVLDVEEFEKFSTRKQNSGEVSIGKRVVIPPDAFKPHIMTAVRLHKNPLFLLISLSRTAHFFIAMPLFTIIVDFSMDKGLLEEDGKYVILAISFGDLLGRLCLGWITDKEYVSLPRYMFLSMVMQGACTATLPLMISKPALLSGLVVFGLLQGSLYVRHPVLVSKYLDSHEQSVAMGCFVFFSGLIAFAIPSYIGYFRDTIGSYDNLFYINGAIGTAVGTLWIFEPCIVKWTY